MAKMWAGRTDGVTSRIADDFNSSIRFDSRMYRQDITGSMAHAAMLGARGIISDADAKALIDGLDGIDGILNDLGVGGSDRDVTADEFRRFNRDEIGGERSDTLRLLDGFRTYQRYHGQFSAHGDALTDDIVLEPVFGVVDQRSRCTGGLHHGGRHPTGRGSGLVRVDVLGQDRDIHCSGHCTEFGHGGTDSDGHACLLRDLLTDLREFDGFDTVDLGVGLEVDDHNGRLELTQGLQASW